MFLEQVDILNFRGIRQLNLTLDDTTVLIGENNTGKTTILDALQLCLGRNLNRKGGIFGEYDYHLATKESQPSDSLPIQIKFHFSERSNGEWPPEVSQILSNAIQVGVDGRQKVILQVSSSFDDTLDDFVTDWNFLDLAGNAMLTAKLPRHIIALQQLVPVFYLSARRDSTEEFRPRAQFWSPFVRSLKIDPALRRELEAELDELNQRVLSANESFGVIEERLSYTGKMVPLATDNPVSIEAIPSRVFDVLSRTQVLLASMTGARLPIGRHGEGTQSLAVICLFDAFLQSRLTDAYTEYSMPILALEEPEAHLHPSAIHSVAALIRDLKGQKLIATHAGDVVAGSSLYSLRRLCRKDGQIAAYQLQNGLLTESEIQKIDYHIRSTRGNLLFARCWLLVEGETDRIVLEGCAKILGHDFVQDSVGFIEYQHIGIGVDAAIKFADAMGIEWFLVADDDQAGGGYVRSGQKQLGARREESHMKQLDHGNIEVFLCMEGFGELYTEGISPQKQSTIDAEPGTLAYWKQVTDAQPNNSKPRNAVAVIDEMAKHGIERVPAQLRHIIERTLTLARGVSDD